MTKSPAELLKPSKPLTLAQVADGAEGVTVEDVEAGHVALLRRKTATEAVFTQASATLRRLKLALS